MNIRSLVMASGIAGYVIAGCASTKSEHETSKTQETSGTTGTSGTSGTTGATETAADRARVQTIEFAKDSSELSEDAKEKMRSLIDAAKQDGGVHEVKVAVWSDNESPARARKELSKEDRELAETRGDNVKNFLKHDLDVRRVKVYNMAEGTNWLAELFHTEAAELEQVFSAEDYRGKVKPEVRLIRDHGKPSHAVLVVEHQRKRTAY